MKKILGIICVFLALASYGQITDDSSELVYSAKTTQIIFENDLKNNQPKERHPDTTLYNLEQFTHLEILGRKFQDLGNNGTAMFPIFYPLQDQIGKTSGFSAFDTYMFEPKDIKYYDSKSPYINLEVVFGGRGRSLVDFAFSRNINPNWNVGFDIYKITSDKQIGREGVTDRNAEGTVFDIYSYYQHPEIPYKAMVSYVNMKFDVAETGGIYIEDLNEATSADLFEYLDADIQLNDARTIEDRSQFHIFHEYNWTEPLQFYHSLDVIRKTSGYQDFADRAGGAYDTYEDFYGQFLLSEDSTYQQSIWKEVKNEIGIKGNLANLYYRLYLKRRDLNFDQLYRDPTNRFSENFLGAYTRFDWKEKFNVEAMGEILPSGEFELAGRLNSDLLFGSYRTTRAKPAFIYETYFGNHHEWNQTFDPTLTNEIKGGVKLGLGQLTVKPQVRLLTLNQFTYFDQEIQPQQSSDFAALASLGGDLSFHFFTDRSNNEAFHLENEVYYTAKSGGDSDKVRVPELFYNGRVFWRGAWFKNTMGVEVGVGLHAKTQYYAHAYAPEIQQFYLQDEFRIESFYTSDFFLNMKINNLRAFVKFTYFNQPEGGGYFVTPYYPGQARVFDFGARWMFFD